MSPTHYLEALQARFLDALPHARELGMQAREVTAEAAHLELPYRPDFLGDPQHGLLHPGVITSVIDTASGLAVFAQIGRFEPIATLDLRVDYLRPGLAGQTLQVRAECYRMTPMIAFVRAQAWQADPQTPVALSQSVFMRASHGRRPAAA
jgi:uncharacterized protein (TIGR00369 family)